MPRGLSFKQLNLEEKGETSLPFSHPFPQDVSQKKIRNKPLVIQAFLFSLKKPKCFETFKSETRFRAVTTKNVVVNGTNLWLQISTPNWQAWVPRMGKHGRPELAGMGVPNRRT